jgi:TPR repeat protein
MSDSLQPEDNEITAKPARTEAELLSAAQGGEVGAMFDLGGFLYEHGNTAGAEHWWRKAAEQGLLDAMNNLGWLLANQGNTAEAEHWYRKAGALGDSGAMNDLGYLLNNKGESSLAAQTWRKAAALGNSTAMYNLGLLLSHLQDDVEAEKWYTEAALLGYVFAQTELAILLDRRGDTYEAEQWYRRAAAAGYDYAMFGLGALLYEKGNTAEAEHWHRKAAEQGETVAMYNLGLFLKNQGNTVEAEHWYRKAANQGDNDSVNELALLMERRGANGQARVYFERAIKAGHVESLFGLRDFLVKIGKQKTAKRKFETFYEDRENEPETRATAAFIRGWLEAELGDGKAAKTWFRNATETDPDSDIAKLAGEMLAGEERDLSWLSRELRRSLGGEDGSVERALREVANVRAAARLRSELNARGKSESGSESESPEDPFIDDRQAAFSLAWLMAEERHSEFTIWYERAARLGDPAAMNNLGVNMYDHEETSQAEDWWRKGVKGRNAEAENNLRRLLNERFDQQGIQRLERELRLERNPDDMTPKTSSEGWQGRGLSRGDHGDWLRDDDQIREYELRKAVLTSSPWAMTKLGEFLSKPERDDASKRDGELWLGAAAALGNKRAQAMREAVQTRPNASSPSVTEIRSQSTPEPVER